jgi:hypothetical protein
MKILQAQLNNKKKQGEMLNLKALQEKGSQTTI